MPPAPQHTYLQEAVLGECHSPVEVHVIAHTFGLAAVHGRVAAEPILKLLL
jgi:hypothetical protein